MTNFTSLPHSRLVAWQEACKLLSCVQQAQITDSRLRDQALRAAQSACLNIAEGAGRTSPADKARVYSIARGEACEAVAGLEVAVLSGACVQEAARRGAERGGAVYALLTGLIRKSKTMS